MEEGGSGMFSWRYDLKVALLCLVEFDRCRKDIFFSFVISIIFVGFILFTHALAFTLGVFFIPFFVLKIPSRRGDFLLSIEFHGRNSTERFRLHNNVLLGVD